jgi:hypothetical protein
VADADQTVSTVSSVRGRHRRESGGLRRVLPANATGSTGGGCVQMAKSIIRGPDRGEPAGASSGAPRRRLGQSSRSGVLCLRYDPRGLVLCPPPGPVPARSHADRLVPPHRAHSVLVPNHGRLQSEYGTWPRKSTAGSQNSPRSARSGCVTTSSMLLRMTGRAESNSTSSWSV